MIPFGFKVEDYEAPEAEVWPENWPAIALYVDNRTQTIQGPGGMVGLNYSWLQSCLDRQGVVAEEAERVMGGIRLIEDMVLERVYEGQ